MPTTTRDPLHDLLRFHRRIRLSIRTFLRVAEAANKGITPNSVELRALIDFFTGPLIWHDIDEEVTLMPRLRQNSNSKFLNMLKVMTAQHEQMEELLESILPHLSKVAHENAIPNGPLLLKEANSLNKLLSDHLRLEEQEVFPLARQVLTQDELEEMAIDMAARLENNKHKMPRVVSLTEDEDELDFDDKTQAGIKS